jgi:hypothetical protein
MNELSNYFELAGITEDMKKIHTAGSRCEAMRRAGIRHIS